MFYFLLWQQSAPKKMLISKSKALVLIITASERENPQTHFLHLHSFNFDCHYNCYHEVAVMQSSRWTLKTVTISPLIYGVLCILCHKDLATWKPCKTHEKQGRCYCYYIMSLLWQETLQVTERRRESWFFCCCYFGYCFHCTVLPFPRHDFSKNYSNLFFRDRASFLASLLSKITWSLLLKRHIFFATPRGD